jgi:methylenetetrahydrofolate reductase (NADPH)
MKPDSGLANLISKGDFIVTAEYLPKTAAQSSLNGTFKEALLKGIKAVNVADNPHGIIMSSLAGSAVLLKAGAEPIYQIVTRDRNRIALQSDLLGAASLGIKNVLCLSGYHQTLSGSPESANVYDIDSIQLVAAITKMTEENELLDGTKIEGDFAMLAGAAANPYLEPLELNVIRVAKKVEAGAKFIQTQAIFDTKVFEKWLKALEKEGITKTTAVLAGVLPLKNAAEAQTLRDTYSDYRITDKVIERLKAAGDNAAQQKEGLAICAEIIKSIKSISGLRGIHILSGGREESLPDLLSILAPGT